jgi:hypothetical protein
VFLIFRKLTTRRKAIKIKYFATTKKYHRKEFQSPILKVAVAVAYELEISNVALTHPQGPHHEIFIFHV